MAEEFDPKNIDNIRDSADESRRVIDEMYDSIKAAFDNTADIIPPPKAYRHKDSFGDKKLLKDFLCMLRSG